MKNKKLLVRFVLAALLGTVWLMPLQQTHALDITLTDAPSYIGLTYQSGTGGMAINKSGELTYHDGKVYRYDYDPSGYYNSGTKTYDPGYRWVEVDSSPTDIHITNNAKGHQGGLSGTPGTIAMGNSTNNTLTMDAGTAVGKGIGSGWTIDMTTSYKNTLNIYGGQLEGTVNVGYGTITLDTSKAYSAGDVATEYKGEITTSIGQSKWDAYNGNYSTQLISNTSAGTGYATADTFNLNGKATGNLTFTTGGLVQVRQGSVVNVTGFTEFAGAAITATADYNTINVNADTKFNTGSSITAQGEHNIINVSERAEFMMGSSISTSAKYNTVNLLLDSATPGYQGHLTMSKGYSTLNVGNHTKVDTVTGSNIAMSGDYNTINLYGDSTYAATMDITDNYQVLNVVQNNTYDGHNIYTGYGNKIQFAQNAPPSPLPPLFVGQTGQVLFESVPGAAGKTNTVNIGFADQVSLGGKAPANFTGSNWLNNDYGSVIGSNVATTDINISAYDTKLLVSGKSNGTQGQTNYVFTGGQVYNIRGRDGTAATKVPPGAPNCDWQVGYAGNEYMTDLTHTAKYTNGQIYNAFSLLNLDEVKVIQNSTLNIGAIKGAGLLTDPNRYNYDAVVLTGDPNYAGRDAQITANNVLVDHGSTMYIHENSVNYGKAGIATNTKNIINYLQVGGEVTIDRTTVHANDLQTGRTVKGIEVIDGGVLYGFGYYKNGNNDHSPLRPNLIGDIVIRGGGTIKPYNAKIFNPAHLEQGVDGHVRDLMGVEWETRGDTEFQQRSILSTRLFHDHDVKYDNDANKWDIDGGLHPLYYSDSVNSTNLKFGTVWNSTIWNDNLTEYGTLDNDIRDKGKQALKVQYNPVYGFNYELRSKLDFEIHQGLDTSDVKTYYFNVANSLSAINELKANGKLMADANHLFNRLILKSDMLGEYQFLYSKDEESIALRYRMLCAHPQQGGIAINTTRRNELLPAKYLDEIRYPFATYWDDKLNLPSEYRPLDLPDDPTIGGAIGTGDKDQMYYYDKNTPDPSYEGYNGNMSEWYAAHVGKPGYEAIDNYRAEWIEDWENLLMGIQLDIKSAADLTRAVRMLHAESYANLSESNFNVMSQFVRNRERNSVSAMYQVERKNHNDPDYEDVGDEIYAGDNERHINMFAENPIRFWAAGFGSEGTQKISGNEHGYDTEIWGGALGVIKEYRDMYFGATIGYSRARNTWDEMSSKGVTNSYLAEALVGARLFNWGFVELHGNYSYGQQEMNRIVNLGGGYYNGWAKGKFNDHLFGGGIRVGYQKLMGAWVFLPTLGVQAMHYRNGSFTEHGRAGMSSLMKFEDGSMNRTVVRTPLMLRLSRSFTVGGNVLTPEIRTGVTSLLGSTRGKAKAEWVGNPFSGRQFVSYGADRGNYEVELGATLELTRRGRFYMAGNYDYVYTKKSHMHNYSVQMGLNF